MATAPSPGAAAAVSLHFPHSSLRILLFSILPSDTCLRFCFLNTDDEVHKLAANEVKLPGQEIEFFGF